MNTQPAITAPDGRTYRGRWPQTIPQHGEGPFIVALAEMVRGVPEVTLPVGRADVATDRDVFEVEHVSHWRQGARQAFSYAGMTGLAPHLALLGSADYLRIYVMVRDRMPGLGLWRWSGHGWEHLTSRKAALRRAPEVVLASATPWPVARVGASVADELAETADQIRTIEARMAPLLAERESLVVEARDAGASCRAIGDLAGISHTAVVDMHRRAQR